MATMQSLLAVVRAVTSGARRDEGQTMAEYGLILAGIAVVVMVAVGLLGGVIDTAFRSIVTQFGAF